MGDEVCHRRPHLTRNRNSLQDEVLEVHTDHNSPEVNGKGWVTSKIQIQAPKKGLVGTVYANLCPNQLIYDFEKIYVPSSQYGAIHIEISTLQVKGSGSSSRYKIEIGDYFIYIQIAQAVCGEPTTQIILYPK